MYWPILLFALAPIFLVCLLIVVLYLALAALQVRAAARLARQAPNEDTDASQR
jgi:hypothetical protein